MEVKLCEDKKGTNITAHPTCLLQFGKSWNKSTVRTSSIQFVPGFSQETG